MATFRVTIEPDMLVWARTGTKLSHEQVARKIGVDATTVRIWEEGADELGRPTLVQLREMAKLFGVPIAAFYMKVPPSHKLKPVTDFRHRGNTTDAPLSIPLQAGFRRVEMQRTVALEIAELSGEVPDRIGIAVAQELGVEAAGDAIRHWLGITVDQQLGWKDDYAALNGWLEAIEARGVLVAQIRGVSQREMLGFAVSDHPFPVVAVNMSQKPRPKMFTVLHELTHVLMHSSGLCALSESSHGQPDEVTETFCNRVAAAVILPRSAMEAEFDYLGVERSPRIWSDSEIEWIADRYWISREVTVRRFVSLDRASLDFFFQKLHQYERQYQSNPSGRQGEGGNPYRTKLLEMGRRYSSDVLRAYRRRLINAHEMTRYLTAKIDYVAEIESLLERRG